MAFQKLQGKKQFLTAYDVADKKRPQEGFLISTRVIPIGSGKKKRDSRVYKMADKEHNPFEVWGCAALDGFLLDEDGENLDPSLRYAWIRVKFTGTKKIKGRPEPMKQVDVDVDTDVQFTGSKGKEYQLKKPAKKALNNSRKRVV